MVMRTLQNELREKGLCNKEVQSTKTKSSKNKSKLSRREVEELMGRYRPTYRRVNGAIRSNK